MKECIEVYNTEFKYLESRLDIITIIKTIERLKVEVANLK
jgi:hypothetical protein